jgi:hypothetical protein
MNRLQWSVVWREDAGLPPGPVDVSGAANVNDLVIVTWINSEGSLAYNNPLDTEQPWPNSTDYNSVGVKNYATLDDGLAATTKTLYNGYYKTLVSILKNPTTAENGISAIYWSPWGSKPTEPMLNNVRHNWLSYATVHVAGTPDINPPSPGVNKKMWLIVATSTGNGYWKIRTTDGAVFAYGDAVYMGGINYTNYPNKPEVNSLVPGDYVTGASGHSTDGYILVTNAGREYAFGSVKSHG